MSAGLLADDGGVAFRCCGARQYPGRSDSGGDPPVRILVVEDSVKMAALLKKGLEREGYAVDVAGSGQDAVWMADENEYDVIVLDIILESGGSSIDGSRCGGRSARQTAGRRCSWSPRGTRCSIGCAAWTSAPTTISRSPSRCRSCSPGCGRSSGARRSRT